MKMNKDSESTTIEAEAKGLQPYKGPSGPKVIEDAKLATPAKSAVKGTGKVAGTSFTPVTMSHPTVNVAAA